MNAAVATLGGIVLCMSLSACQTTITTADGSAPVPRPTNPVAPPSSAKPNALAITFAPKPSDTNGNQRPDSLQVTAYLFSRPHPSPLFAEGAFHFAIYRLGESGMPDKRGPDPLREWSFDAAFVQGARSNSLAGPCHELVLSLLEAGGSDTLPVESVDLVAWFEPSDGSGPVWLRGIRSVQFQGPLR